MAWTIAFCYSAARQSEYELEFIMDRKHMLIVSYLILLFLDFGLIRTNPAITNVGAAVVDFGGYPIERPIERNW